LLASSGHSAAQRVAITSLVCKQRCLQLAINFGEARNKKMEMSPGTRLTAGAVVLAAAIGYLAYVGAASSWQYYVSVDEMVADATSFVDKRVRVSGRVAVGSLTISERRQDAEFDLVGTLHKLHASCRCQMPDNLAEDIDVVVEGVLQGDRLQGSKVITRCASKYEPKTTIATHNKTPARSAQR
jgi:cytochrome c-type biogenesis protein CcmE